MKATRRAFLQNSVVAGVAGVGARGAFRRVDRFVTVGGAPDLLPRGIVAGPSVRELALRAVDAAKAAGATYADARLSYTRYRDIYEGGRTPWGGWMPRGPHPVAAESAELGIGVRALVDGAWGFSAAPLWDADAAVWLGRDAVVQARATAADQSQPVEFTPATVVHDGTWATPVRIDPFDTPLEEVCDWANGISEYGAAFLPPLPPPGSRWGVEVTFSFVRQETTFASSEGSRYAQTITTIHVGAMVQEQGQININRTPAFLGHAAAGLEFAYDQAQAIKDWFPQAVTEIQAIGQLPERPVEPGRFTMVWDAASVGDFTARSLGPATQLSRVLGEEANTLGTSYLGPVPTDFLGSQVAAPNITITADRTRPLGAATVKWDAEGVAVAPFPIVKDGVLVDYQTTRSHAAALAPYYQKVGDKSVRSNGCADAPSALVLPLTHTPNLVLTPGTEAARREDLVAGLDHGLLLRKGSVTMDFQGVTGLGFGEVYEVRKGRPVARMVGAGTLLRSPEVWKSITALGDAASAEAVTTVSTGGEPSQQALHTVWAIPMVLKDVAVVDITRKAQ